MKICASCGVSLPDQAVTCPSCGSQEFTYPAQNGGYAQQDQYGYDDQYQGEYAEDYQDQQYDGYEDDYGEEYADDGYQQQYQQPQYQQQYQQNGQQYAQQYDDGSYDDEYDEEYDDGYGQQYQQSTQQYSQQPQYQQNGQQYAQQYDDGSYDDEYDEEYDDGYDQQYSQQPQYSQQNTQQYSQQYDDQYEDEYEDDYQQQQYPQQDDDEDLYDEPEPQQPAVAAAPVQQPAPSYSQASEPQPKKSETPKPKEFNPHEASKNFTFEKKDKSEQPAEEEGESVSGTQKIVNMFTETKDHTSDFDPNDASANKLFAILACLGITFWVPLAFRKDSHFARFYANQGLLTLIVSIPFIIIYAIFSGIVGVACTSAGSLGGGESLSITGYIVKFILFLIIYAIPIFFIARSISSINKGKAVEIPFVGFLTLIRY